MKVTWDDLSGISHTAEQPLSFASFPSPYTTTTSTASPSQEVSVFESSGVRKAILLVQYTDFFKKYIDLRAANSTPEKIAILSSIFSFYLFLFL
jgi:hypothetical protein